MSYLYSRSISIDHTKCGSSNSSDFPLLFSGTYSWLATTANGGHVTNSNGYDIVFSSDSAGNNLLNFERELYTASNGQVIFWVQVPTLSHTANTVIYIWYGNSSITTDQSNASGTWDSNFQGVYHLGNGTTLSANDSTSNARNGTINGATASSSGQIDGAAALNISADNQNYISITGLFGDPTSVTLSGWANYTTDYGGGGVLVSLGYNVGIQIDSDGSQLWGFVNFAGSGSSYILTYNQTYAGTGWHHFVFTVSTTTLTLYVDGVQVASGSNSGGISYASTDGGTNTFIGQDTEDPGGSDFAGYIDEIRVSSSVRTADWITAEHNNQSSPSTFYSISTQIHNASLSDSFSLTDALKRKPSKVLSEAFSVVDVLARTPKKKFSETVSPTDKLSRTPGKKLTDTVSPTDTLKRTPGKKLSETITPSDQLTRKPGKGLRDTISPTERLVKALARALTDTISPTDRLARRPGKKLTETISPSDRLTRTPGKSLKETVAPTDRLVKAPAKALRDTASPSDRLTRATTRNLHDTVSPTDALKRRTTKALVDSVSLVEAFVSHLVKLLALHDTISLADALTRHSTLRLQDSVSPADGLTRHTFKVLHETVSPLDALKRGIRKRLADSAVPNDRLTRTTGKHFADSFSLSDAFQSVLRLPGAIRKFMAQWLRRIFRASEEDQMITDVKKPAASSEKFEIDWTELLTDNLGNVDSITESTWAVNPTDMTAASSSYTTTTATAQLAAGTVGTYYVVENTITTASGQTKVQSLLILVTE